MAPMWGVVAVLFMVVHVGLAAVPAYCQAPQRAAPEPPLPPDADQGWAAQPKLLQAQVLATVGQRERTLSGTCWRPPVSDYDCSLTVITAPFEASTGNQFARVYSVKAVHDSNELPGTCFMGQLTAAGYQTQHFTGLALGSAYVGEGKLISSNITTAIRSGSLYLRSAQDSASMASGQAFFSGVMPPVGGVGFVEIVDWYTVDPAYDYLYPNPDICPKLGPFRSTILTSPTYQTHINATVWPLKEKLSPILGIPASDVSLPLLQDCILSHQCQGRAMPAALNQSVVSDVMQANLYQEQFLYKNTTYKQLAAGYLLSLLVDNINNATALYNVTSASLSGQPKPTGLSSTRLVVYSGPTEGVGTSFLGALGVLGNLTGFLPPFSSTVVLELYLDGVPHGTNHVTAPPASFSVRVLYNNKAVAVPGCPKGVELCPLSTFFNIIKPLQASPSVCHVDAAPVVGAA